MAYEIQDATRSTPRVARKRQLRMQRIVRSALAIARAEGQAALTLQRVAEAMGVTAASLYRYFPSKDALDAELQRSVIAWLARATREQIDAAETSRDSRNQTDELLPVVISAFVFERFARSAPVEFGLLTMHLSTPGYQLPARDAAGVFETAWESLVDLAGHLEHAAQVRVLAPGSSTERAVTLWAALQGVVQTRKLIRSASGRIEPTALVHAMVPALLVGWGAEADLVAATVRRVLDHHLAEPRGSVDDLLEADAA